VLFHLATTTNVEKNPIANDWGFGEEGGLVVAFFPLALLLLLGLHILRDL
jgi:hypothetical protein